MKLQLTVARAAACTVVFFADRCKRMAGLSTLAFVCLSSISSHLNLANRQLRRPCQATCAYFAVQNRKRQFSLLSYAGLDRTDTLYEVLLAINTQLPAMPTAVINIETVIVDSYI